VGFVGLLLLEVVVAEFAVVGEVDVVEAEVDGDDHGEHGRLMLEFEMNLHCWYLEEYL